MHATPMAAPGVISSAITCPVHTHIPAPTGRYIFSDKTGTLTRNLMEFKMCSIAGLKFGRMDDGLLPGAVRHTGAWVSAVSAA